MKKFLSGSRAVALVLFIALTVGALSVFAAAAGTEADAFNNAVTTLEGKTEIAEQQTALEAADLALEAYLEVSGNKKTDSAISAKYSELVEIKNSMFIAYVEAASDAQDDDDYPATRENLDYAGAILDTLASDELTNSAKTFKVTYQDIVDELKAPEELSANYILRAEAAKNAKTFDEAKRNYDSAKQIEKNLTLTGYPGIEEAKATLKEVQTYLSRCTIAASDFLNAVDNIYMNDNYFEGIEDAYDAYEALEDTTVTGVSDAKSRLDGIVSSHNKGAVDGNALANDTNSIIYGLILGNGESSSGNPFIDWANKTFG